MRTSKAVPLIIMSLSLLPARILAISVSLLVESSTLSYRRSLSRSRIPHWYPTDRAVESLSPVRIHTFMPASIKSLMQVLTSSYSLSARPEVPRRTKSFSISLSGIFWTSISLNSGFYSSTRIAKTRVRRPSSANSSRFLFWVLVSTDYNDSGASSG
jgi:hypothetical protein